MNAEHLCFQFQVDGIRPTSLVENKLSGLSFLRVLRVLRWAIIDFDS